NAGPLAVVWAEIVATPGTAQGMATIEQRTGNGILISSASVPGVEATDRFIFPLDSTSATPVGLAIANVNRDTAFNVIVRLVREDGFSVLSTTDARFRPFGSHRQIADFIEGLIPQLKT